MPGFHMICPVCLSCVGTCSVIESVLQISNEIVNSGDETSDGGNKNLWVYRNRIGTEADILTLPLAVNTSDTTLRRLGHLAIEQ